MLSRRYNISVRYHCHVNDHIDAGMVAMYHVDPRGSAGDVSTAADSGDDAVASVVLAPTPGGRQRTYYLAAEDVEWDYAPSGRDRCGEAADTPIPTHALKTHGSDADDRIGSKYQKGTLPPLYILVDLGDPTMVS